MNVSAALDRLARPEVRVLGRSLPTFRICGAAGLCVALAVAAALTRQRGLSPGVMAALALAAVATFLTLAMVTKIVTGVETLTYYHHEIAIVGVAAALLALLHRPVLAYLDVTVLGIGLFLACGRIGCFLTGCCHGRPQQWGVRYSAAHAKAGLPACYAGVRLFPVPLLEALGALAITASGAALLARGSPPGRVFGWYVAVYAVARFGLEFLRGDPDRRYVGRFSEAQWTSWLLAVALLGVREPFVRRIGAGAAGVMLLMAAVWLIRQRGAPGGGRMWHPRHLQEIAEMVQRLREAVPAGDFGVCVGNTSQGIQVSVSREGEGEARVHHYAFSWPGETLTEKSAAALAGLLVRLDGTAAGGSRMVRSSRGVFHVLVSAYERGGAPMSRAEAV